MAEASGARSTLRKTAYFHFFCAGPIQLDKHDVVPVGRDDSKGIAEQVLLFCTGAVGETGRSLGTACSRQAHATASVQSEGSAWNLNMSVKAWSQTFKTQQRRM